MGLTIREVVEEIGGGSSTGKKLKAVQMGGPAGAVYLKAFLILPSLMKT